MAFYNQTQANQPDYRCGAFCLAYFKWLREGRTPAGAPADMDADEAAIAEIYDQVAFKNGNDVIGFSNPLQIKDYLTNTLQLQHCTMYRGAGNRMQEAIETFQATVAGTETPLEAIANHVAAFYTENQHNFQTSNIPALNPGDSAIAIFAGNGALHYMLFKNDDGAIRLYDPATGNESEVGAITPGALYNDMNFTGAGIHIPNQEA